MKTFSTVEQNTLKEIILSRRDVRGHHFSKTPLERAIVEEILTCAIHAPSVGFSQPWRFLMIENDATKERIYKEFVKQNAKAQALFKSEALYSRLKLEGIQEAPLNIAVFYKKPEKTILGQTVQKKMGEYSVVCAIQNLWLSARSHGIGIGWVSILRPKKVKKILNIDKNYALVGYLCVGYVSEFLEKPELETLGWETKKNLEDVVQWV
ncbi:5,6-dimethylbenzimidazole synthase [Sulfurospirillum barnesii]|uniref:Cob(II)yrinic acid a,c-diamide reductase n=1 Tax=Sulfurospirillum barnesii (strain ATCC 700032 / DSM 10660 / SES-3) TaxID=760154 RepID=I3XZN3_SULBS|nr:5,6-dimethylbenzimidazole synthase [Sulfurospirillum barnesii]AFL69407.1 cob(II)yrinic acid a,c-diamide reductase [Sulfurospirillum barnesii SES-3]